MPQALLVYKYNSRLSAWNCAGQQPGPGCGAIWASTTDTVSAIWRYSLYLLSVVHLIDTNIAFHSLRLTVCHCLADVDIKCASTYFRYGAALFYKAQDEQDVFGSTLQAAAANDEADVAEDEESGKRSCVLNSASDLQPAVRMMTCCCLRVQAH